MSGELLRAFQDEEAYAAAQANIKREPMSGRLHHDQPFGGGEPSEMSFDTSESQRNATITSDSGFNRRGLTRTMSQSTCAGGSGSGTASAWATHPSVANRAASVAFGADQPDIKPLLGWYGEDAGEEGLRQLATMQAKLNQRLGPEYVSSRAGPGGGPKLHYLEGWKAIDLANDVFGFNGWSTNLVRLDTDFIDVSADGSRCNVGVSAIMRVTLRDGTFHEDIGYGHIENAKGKAAALEKAKKEAVTDALKRSLRTFGRLVGNCMYDKKYLETVSKMRPDAQKYDVSQLHRRIDLNAPPPPAQAVKQEDDGHAAAETNFRAPSTASNLSRTTSSSVAPCMSTGTNGIAANSSHYPDDRPGPEDSYGNVPLKRANTAAPNVSSSGSSITDGNVRPSAAVQERIRAERQALAAERQAAFRLRQEEQRLLVAQSSGQQQQQQQQKEGRNFALAENGAAASAASSAPRLPPAQPRRAPPAPIVLQPPRPVPDSAAGRVYGKEPGARWTARSSLAAATDGGPQVRPDTAQMMEGIDDSVLAGAAEMIEGHPPQGVGQPSGPGAAAAAATAPPEQPRRAPSAGRFVDPNEALGGSGTERERNHGGGGGSSVGSIGGVTSLSAAGGLRGSSPVNGPMGGVKRVGITVVAGASLPEQREPLKALDVDEGGSVKRQKR